MADTKLMDLATRCEQATGPDRELDFAISLALGDDRKYGSGWVWDGLSDPPIRISHGDRLSDLAVKYPHGSGMLAIWFQLPTYTASIDAALALLDDRHWTAWELRSRGGLSRYVAEISRIDENKEEEMVSGHARTPALAFCAAALRAAINPEAGG